VKENLTIECKNESERIEAQQLLFSLGFVWMNVGKNLLPDFKLNYLNANSSGMYLLQCDSPRQSFKSITLPELRELAKPREYLNSEFELVVTNQPLGWYRKIPDNADIFCLAKDGYSFFWVNGKQHYDDGRFCDSSMHNFSQWCEIHLKKILWQRENKVETVKGRFLHQEWYEAFGRGEELEFKSPNYAYCFIQLNPNIKMSIFDDTMATFRLKPKTITIGSRTIVKPISVKPERNTRFYLADIAMQDKYNTFLWNDSEADRMLLGRGICHLTKEDAVAHTEALLELMK